MVYGEVAHAQTPTTLRPKRLPSSAHTNEPHKLCTKTNRQHSIMVRGLVANTKVSESLHLTGRPVNLLVIP